MRLAWIALAGSCCSLVLGAGSACRWNYELSLGPEDTVGFGGATRGSSGGGSAGGSGGQENLAGTGASGSQGGAGAVDLGPFGPATAIDEIFVGSFDAHPSFTDDLLELYFTTGRGTAQNEIWVSKRSLRSDPWGAPESVAIVNAGGVRNLEPGVTSDGLALYFTRYITDDIASRDIYMTSRPDRLAPWSEPVLVDASEPSSGDVAPCGTLDERMLVWSRWVEVGAVDVVFSERTTMSAPWPDFASVPVINSPSTDIDPWLSDSKLHIFFSSDRPTEAQYDLYFASRASTDEDFGEPQLVMELSGDFDERGPSLSQDLRTIMFSSDRDGVGRIYVAQR